MRTFHVDFPISVKLGIADTHIILLSISEFRANRLKSGRAFVTGVNKITFRVHRETVWRLGSKERLCTESRSARACSFLLDSDTMTCLQLALHGRAQLARCLWSIPRPGNHPGEVLRAHTGGFASLIGRVAEPADRLLMSSFCARVLQFILVACIIGITVPPSNLLPIWMLHLSAM